MYSPDKGIIYECRLLSCEKQRGSWPVSTLMELCRDNWLACLTQKHGSVPRLVRLVLCITVKQPSVIGKIQFHLGNIYHVRILLVLSVVTRTIRKVDVGFQKNLPSHICTKLPYLGLVGRILRFACSECMVPCKIFILLLSALSVSYC